MYHPQNKSFNAPGKSWSKNSPHKDVSPALLEFSALIFAKKKTAKCSKTGKKPRWILSATDT